MGGRALAEEAKNGAIPGNTRIQENSTQRRAVGHENGGMQPPDSQEETDRGGGCLAPLGFYLQNTEIKGEIR